MAGGRAPSQKPPLPPPSRESSAAALALSAAQPARLIAAASAMHTHTSACPLWLCWTIPTAHVMRPGACLSLSSARQPPPFRTNKNLLPLAHAPTHPTHRQMKPPPGSGKDEGGGGLLQLLFLHRGLGSNEEDAAEEEKQGRLLYAWPGKHTEEGECAFIHVAPTYDKKLNPCTHSATLPVASHLHLMRVAESLLDFTQRFSAPSSSSSPKEGGHDAEEGDDDDVELVSLGVSGVVATRAWHLYIPTTMNSPTKHTNPELDPVLPPPPVPPRLVPPFPRLGRRPPRLRHP